MRMGAQGSKFAQLRKRVRAGRAPRVMKPGIPPGTLMEQPGVRQPEIRVFTYDTAGFEERTFTALDEFRAFASAQRRERHGKSMWVDVDASGHRATVQVIGEVFELHALALEDVLNGHQRPKTEQYEQFVFVVLRMLDMRDGHIDGEQLSLFLGEGFVVTFQERQGDCLDPVRTRIRTANSPLRARGADYLAYSIIDCVIDHYFPLLEEFGDRLDVLEDEILERVQRRTVEGIHCVKRELLHVRRAVWPLRDAIGALQRDEHSLIKQPTRIFLRDCYDHTVRVIDLVENYRELGADLTDMHLTMVSNRMNEIMKVLTIIATIFIPLTFIVGVYGMNFKHFPELDWVWGYPAIWAVMLSVAAGMVVYFWRKGWIGGNGEGRKE